MQLKLPIYPADTKLISSCVGVSKQDDIVQYIANGLPIYSHDVDDHRSFRFITSSLIHQGLCRKVDVERCFHVSSDSVARWYNKFEKKGTEAFYGEDARKGTPYKIIGKKRDRIQSKLNKGQSVNSVAKEESVRESAIRYQIKQGYLKKSRSQPV